jgi:hypothetical protein
MSDPRFASVKNLNSESEAIYLDTGEDYQQHFEDDLAQLKEISAEVPPLTLVTLEMLEAELLNENLLPELPLSCPNLSQLAANELLLFRWRLQRLSLAESDFSIRFSAPKLILSRVASFLRQEECSAETIDQSNPLAHSIEIASVNARGFGSDVVGYREIRAEVAYHLEFNRQTLSAIRSRQSTDMHQLVVKSIIRGDSQRETDSAGRIKIQLPCSTREIILRAKK